MSFLEKRREVMEVEAANVASVSISVQIVMLVFTFIVGHLLRRKKIMVLHEAGAALLLGVLVGLMVRISGEERGFKTWINFNNRFFFYFLLPPIIFESGWSLRSKPFFSNFGAICVFAFGGTLISTFGVGILIYLFGIFNWTHSMPFLVCLAFGALISATDPVTVLSIFHELGTDANLYAYVFGESVLNDAVAIVMYKTVLSFITGPINDQGILEAMSFFIVIFVGSFSTGLRGAMAFALARQSVTDLPSGHGHILLTATLLTIFFTVLFIGGLTSYVLKFLKIECHGPTHDDEDVDDESLEEAIDNAASTRSSSKSQGPAGFMVLGKQKDTISRKLQQLKTGTSFASLDTKYIKPFLQAAPVAKGSELSGMLHSSGQTGNQANPYTRTRNITTLEEEEIDTDEVSETQGLLKSSK